MSKCIEKPGNRAVLGGLGRLFDYECPICHDTYSSKGSCTSHVYKKHQEWALEDTQKTLNELRVEKNRRKR